MRKRLALLSALFLVAVPSQAAPRLSPEADLARTLEGRVAGKPVDCIYLPRVRSSRIINNTAIVYDAGGTIYVNRPQSGREQLDQFDVLVTRPFGTQLCSIDTVQLYDSASRFQTGIVFLGDFVPYRKVERPRD